MRSARYKGNSPNIIIITIIEFVDVEQTWSNYSTFKAVGVMAEAQHLYVAVPLALFALSVSLAYPYLFMKLVAPKNTQRTSRALDATISFSIGIVLTHCIVHIVPLVDGLVQVANQLPPLSGAIPAVGFLTVHLLHGISRAVQGRNKLNRDRMIPCTTARKCVMRPLPRRTYMALLAMASAYGAVEGVVIAAPAASTGESIIDTSGNCFRSFFKSQLITAISLGVLALKTCCSPADLLKADILFVTATSVGIYAGWTLQGNDMVPATYMFLATIAGLSSGAHLKLLVDDVLPEITPPTSRRLRYMGLGAVVYLHVVYYCA